MSAGGVLALCALAGLNPWVVLLLSAGLAAYTRHARVHASFAPYVGTPLVLLLAPWVGVDVVAGKVKRLVRVVEAVDLVASAAAGALLAAALDGGTPATPPLVIGGALLALAVRLLRRRVSRPIERWLHPLGHIATGILADMLAGTLAAAVFALKP